MLQNFMIPYSLTKWLFFPDLSVSSYEAFNGTIEIKDSISQRARLKDFQPIKVVSSSSMKSTTSNMTFSKSVKTVRRKGKSAHQRGSHTPKKHKVEEIKVPPRLAETVSPSVSSNHSARWERYISSLTPDQALVYAKKEINNASIIADDPDLDAPIFRNVSIHTYHHRRRRRLVSSTKVHLAGAASMVHFSGGLGAIRVLGCLKPIKVVSEPLIGLPRCRRSRCRSCSRCRRRTVAGEETPGKIDPANQILILDRNVIPVVLDGLDHPNDGSPESATSTVRRRRRSTVAPVVPQSTVQIFLVLHRYVSVTSSLRQQHSQRHVISTVSATSAHSQRHVGEQ
ncbi:hypothetical protein ACLOJK_034454 [Asimina triloba]